ncbi:MAG: FAD-binding oxidoreductase [Actinobacteria bacterium]|nr:FAD-binding oxidoreductase [Actinomycetota bacterium]
MSDFVVIGGGIAGVAAAAHLAPYGKVTLLEMEATLAYHTTGRSAALYVINYGAQGTRPLALASRGFLESPPEGTVDAPILSDRGLLWVGTEAQMGVLEEMAEQGKRSGAESELVSKEGAIEILPALRENWVAGGLYEPLARDIDVAGLHQAFVRIARSNDADIRNGSPVTEINRKNGGWTVTAGGETISCDVVVNASGAWGDLVAGLAGVAPIGLQPMRRTAFMVPGSQAYHHWPMTVEAEQHFYFKPDGVQFLCSLAEEVPEEPGDPRPRMEDVALAIERINEATILGIRAVNSQWTGLRTFAPDRDLVIGEDPTTPGFYWLVGQGGTGIQTSPAYGSLLASLATGSELAPELAAAGVDPAVTSPSRFR